MSKWVTRACITFAGVLLYGASKRLFYGPEVLSTGAAIMHIAIAMVLLYIGIKYDHQDNQ